MIAIADLFRESLSSGALWAAPLALAGGVVTGLNPCCLPIYPAAATACCANRESGEGSVRKLRPGAAVALTFGLATAPTLLGLLAALGGHTMTAVSGTWAYVFALILAVAGAHVLGLIKLPAMSVLKVSKATSILNTFLYGFLLALVLSPCGTPLLAGLLSYVAFQGNAVIGGLLLFLYGVGIAVPVVALGAMAAKLATRLERSGWRVWVDRATGIMLIAVGAHIAFLA